MNARRRRQEIPGARARLASAPLPSFFAARPRGFAPSHGRTEHGCQPSIASRIGSMKVDRGSRIRIRNDAISMIAQIAARWMTNNERCHDGIVHSRPKPGGTFLLLEVIF